MNTNELRIGNIVDTVHRGGTVYLPANRPMKVYDIAPFGVSLYPPDKNPAIMAHVPTYDIKDICPFRITEILLLQSGFLSVGMDGFNEFKHYRFKSDIPHENILLRATKLYEAPQFSVFNHSECDSSQAQYITTVEYVHELQNLFFSITGRELEITI